MKEITVDFMDVVHMTNSDRCAAESAYRSAIITQVPNVDLLAMIYTDNLAGVNAGALHFESCYSAWDQLNRIGVNAAEKAISYWPNNAHFEVKFYD